MNIKQIWCEKVLKHLITELHNIIRKIKDEDRIEIEDTILEIEKCIAYLKNHCSSNYSNILSIIDKIEEMIKQIEKNEIQQTLIEKIEEITEDLKKLMQ